MLALNLPSYHPKISDRKGIQCVFDPIRQKWVKLTPEEWVRQHFVNYLVEEKGYPSTLMANEVAISLNNRNRRCDTVVYDGYMSPLMILEYKAPSVAITEEVFRQIARYNFVLRVSYLIVSNGLDHYCCQLDLSSGTYSFLKGIPSYAELQADALK